MSSVQTKYAQRNNNLVQIIPDNVDTITTSVPFFEMSNVAAYSLTLPNVNYAANTYYVDLGGKDSEGQVLNSAGTFASTGGVNGETNMIVFGINVPFNPAYGPGVEFTIFFKNPQLITPLYSVGLVNFDGAPFPEIVSPPIPLLMGPDISLSLTFKSDGTKYNVVSSGPAGWLGVFALSAFLAAASL